MQGLQRQQRLYYKNKVGDIISSYERNQQEQQRQKADLKKNVMLSILNSRKALNPQPEPAPKSHPQIKQQPLPLKSPPLIMQSQPVEQQSRQQPLLEEITFNAKKRNKSLEEEITFKESYLNLLRERRLKEDPPEDAEEKEEDGSRRNGSPPIQRSVYKSSHSSEEEGSEGRSSKASLLQKYSNFKQSLKQELHQSQQPKQEDEYEDDEIHKYQYQDEEQEEQPQEYSKYDKAKEQLSYLQAFKEKYSKERLEKEQRIRERQQRQQRQAQEEREREVEQQQARKREEEREQEERGKGVFLTMEESQSMVAEDGPKSYAFEIKMDKSTNPNDLEQLKQQRIREIQKKRQERIEEFRRNESQKKVEMPRGKNSYSKKPDKQTLNESDAPPPRSATIQRKGNPPPAPKNESSRVDQRDYPRTIPVQSQESQYSIRPPSSKHLPPNPSYHPDPEPRPPTYKQSRNNNFEADREKEKPLSPFRTPKSMTEQGRGKSGGKSTGIFQGEGQRERSSNKEARLQPKDRKNSFTRQSNKKQMVNAITYVVFPGELNRKERERLTDIIEGSPHEFFVFLFKEYSRKMIKAIYVYDGSQTALRKIYGEKSPNEITAEMVQEFYKYDNGSREFKRIDGCRSFSFSISAIDLRK